MEQIENRLVLNELKYEDDEEEYNKYLEHLLEEDDRGYEDEIFERLGEK